MNAIDLRKDLVEACKRQDRQAQKTLYLSYADAMYNVACRIVNNEADAQDVLQSAFVDVFRSIQGFKYQSTPGAWIKKIVINRALTFLKNKKRMPFETIDDEVIHDLPEEEHVEVDLDINQVRIAIKNLPDGYRAVLSLYLIEGYDHKEIGQILGIAEATSKSQYSRAKSKLRQMLKGTNI